MLVLPDVTGLPLEAAIALIENAGFGTPQWLYEESFSPVGTVLSTKPLAKTMVRADRPIVLHVSQQSLIRFLPTVFQEGRTEEEADLLKRFLWIGHHLYESVQLRADAMSRMLAPYTVEEEFLPWLASWVALSLDEEWEDWKKRKFLSRASEMYTRRGTARFLQEIVEVFTGVTPEIEENRWPYDGFRIGVSSSVGEDTIIFPEVNLAHCFVVQLPVAFEDLGANVIVKIHEIIRQEKPAHTMYFLQFAGDRGVTVDETVMAIGVGLRIGTEPEAGGSME